MRKPMMFKFAVSSTALAITAIGCSPGANMRPASLSSAAPKKAAAGAARSAEKSIIAVRLGDRATATVHAEEAVGLSPSDAGYRALLAQLYFEAGRFASAEAAYRDVLALDPSNGKALIGTALAQIAQGRHLDAQTTLAAAGGVAAPADLGLALALAGDPRGAVAVLEPAAREVSSTAKLRQNLALAYALAGQWDKARVTAEIDVPANEIKARMESWAKLANPASATDQIVALLGIAPAADPGRPERLALVPVSPAAASAAALAPVAAPIAVASAPKPAPQPVIEAPQLLAEAPVAAPPVEATADVAPVRAIPYRMPTETLSAPLLRAPPKRVVVASTEPADVAPFVARPVVAQRAGGRFVVQLGAFSDARRVEAAWDSVSTRMARLSGFAPSKAAFTLPSNNAILHRLSIAGIAKREDAVKLCGTIRAAGGACFVREAAGDAPMQWVKRDTGKRQQTAQARPKPVATRVQIASR